MHLPRINWNWALDRVPLLGEVISRIDVEWDNYNSNAIDQPKRVELTQLPDDRFVA